MKRDELLEAIVSTEDREEIREEVVRFLHDNKDAPEVKGAVTQTDDRGIARVKDWRESVTEDGTTSRWKNIKVPVPEGVFEPKTYAKRSGPERVESLARRIFHTVVAFGNLSDGHQDLLLSQIETGFVPGQPVTFERCRRIAIQGLQEARRKNRALAQGMVTAPSYLYD